MILRNELLKRVEPFFIDSLLQPSYEIKIIPSKLLLTHTRFDLAFKLLYIEMLEKDVAFANYVYKEHIRAFSLGSYQEPGQEDKSSIERFYSTFNEIFADIKSKGFDSSKSLIPLSENGSIANGAHRVASAIYLNKEIASVKIDTNDHIYDYRFFYKRNVAIELLDVAATKFVEYADNVHIAFIWPAAHGHDQQVENVIPNIVYRKDVKLAPNGAHNLLSQIYLGEPWLGSVENNFSGSKGKLAECFKTFGPVRVVAFLAPSLDEVIVIKEKVRNIFDVGKHSIHITDTKEEAVRLARVIFNDNSIHFLNHAQPNKYQKTHRRLAKFRTFISDNHMDTEDIVLDGGIVLSLYGLRNASDIDYLAAKALSIEYNDEELECHDEELKYHDEGKNELIYNPKYYFYFNDMKFISFDQVYRMKNNRNEIKDKNDCKLMESLIESNQFKKIKGKIKQNVYYGKIKLRLKLIYLFKLLGVFGLAKKVYRAMKNESS